MVICPGLFAVSAELLLLAVPLDLGSSVAVAVPDPDPPCSDPDLPCSYPDPDPVLDLAPVPDSPDPACFWFLEAT